MTEEIEITEAEWEVMRVIWTEKETTSKEISEILENEKSWKPATTKTLIGRLKKKEMITAKKEGRRNIYSPAVSEEDSIHQRMEDILNDICNTNVGKVVSRVVTEAPISQSEIDALIEQLEEKKKGAPESIECQCAPGQCIHHRFES